jgi:3-hydroxyisobutyrate dehydrogenase-like beta-hydroxyacid dehydrogenase
MDAQRELVTGDPIESGRARRLAVGIVGVGNMGRAMAGVLLDHGFEVTINDIDRGAASELEARGAIWSDSPRGVAEASKVTLTILPGPHEVEMVVLGPNGILAGASAHDIVIDMSTSTPASIQRIAEQASSIGVEVLDAPVSGGVRGARKATLVIMVGGTAAAFERCRSVLETLGSQVFHMGPLGSGHVAKLVNNYMGISNALVSMEAMVLGVKAGVDPVRLLEVVNLGTGASHMTRTLFPFLIFPGRFEPARFSMALAAKDMRLAVDLAAESDVPIRVGLTVLDALDEAAASDLAAADMSAYITLLEAVAAVKVRA